MRATVSHGYKVPELVRTRQATVAKTVRAYIMAQI